MIRELRGVDMLAVSMNGDGSWSGIYRVVREAVRFGGGGGMATVCADAPEHKPKIEELPMVVDNDLTTATGVSRFVVCGSCGEVLSGPGPGLFWAIRLWFRGLL